MYEGQLIVCDEPQRIQARVVGELIELRPDDGPHAREVLTNAPGVLEMQTYGDLLHVFLDSVEKRLPDIEALLHAQHVAYRDLRQTQPRMEEAFVSLIQHREN
jgi:ABC-type multidrug transport system ATPase subunit